MTEIDLGRARKLWLDGQRLMRLAMGGVEVWAQKIKTAFGSLITLTDALDDPVRSLKVEGKSVQDGTPSPEFPQAIQSVKNPVVEVRGKNLFDPSAGKWTVGWWKTLTSKDNNYAVCSTTPILLDAGNYVLRSSFENDRRDYLFVRIVSQGGSEVSRSYSTALGGDVFTFSINEKSWISIQYNSAFASASQERLFELDKTLQIEKGSTATAYEPYIPPQTRTIPVELRSIGDVKDEWIWNRDGSADWVQRIGAVNLKSHPSGNWAKSTSYPGGYYVGNYSFTPRKAKDYGEFLCSHFTYSPNGYKAKISGYSICDSTHGFMRPECATLEDWLAFIQDNDIIDVFEMETPITTHYTASEVASMVGSKPELILGTSIIEASSEEVKPEVEVEYLA